MTDAAIPISFHYEAQTPEGLPLRGTIEAADFEAARANLETLNLRVLHMAAETKPARPRPMRGTDFVIFNQQLAQMAKAGMPLEHGLRMIARDVRGRRLAHTIEQVADELERGKPLAEAFEAHRGQFPAFYGQLVEAGVRSGNLAGVLFSLGWHLDTVHRIRGMIWRAAAYPFVLLCVVFTIIAFMSYQILPEFQDIFHDFDAELPLLTKLVINSRDWLLVGSLGVIALIVASPLVWRMVVLAGMDRYVVDYIVLPLPLMGRVMQASLLARWCDTVKVCVLAGLDLPASIRLAANAVASPTLLADSAVLIHTIESGRPAAATNCRLLTGTVTATLDLAQGQEALASALEMLSEMYQQQAELRLSVVQVVLGPILLAMLAGIVGFVVIALFLPLVKLINSVM